LQNYPIYAHKSGEAIWKDVNQNNNSSESVAEDEEVQTILDDLVEWWYGDDTEDVDVGEEVDSDFDEFMEWWYDDDVEEDIQEEESQDDDWFSGWGWY